jgi:hypothetical protein
MVMQKGVLMTVLALEQISTQTVAIWRHIRLGLALGIVVILIQACADLPFGTMSASTPAEQKSASVRERADLRWQALIRDDIPKAYAYLSPATRDVVTVDQYKAKVARGTFKAAKVDSVQCEAELCKVKIQLTYDRARMKGIVTPIDEIWILERGQFWYVYRT